MQVKHTQEIDPLSSNRNLAEVLNLIGSYYTMDKDTYRARAFTTAAGKIADHPTAILSGSQAKRELTGIGESIESAIEEYLTTGIVKRLNDLESKFTESKRVIDYFRSFYGIGPVTAVKFYNQGFRTLDDIWFKGNLTDAQKIGVMWRDHIHVRIPRDEMNQIDKTIESILQPYGIKWTIAGSYRRQEASSGDIDLLVQSQPDLNMDGIISLLKPIIPDKLAQGERLFMGILRLDNDHYGHRIDIKLFPPESWPYALLYFTGSQKFNILMRQHAISMGLKLNEYGLYDANGVSSSAASEEEIFRRLKVKYLPPVKRITTIDNLEVL